MNAKFTYDFVVRGYELDSFGHVNNAVYLNYLEQARWEIMERLDLLEYFKETGSFLIVTESRIKYIHELNIFDKALVETSMQRSGFFVEFRQHIFMRDNRRKIAKASAKCLFVDKDRNPLDIPDQLKSFLADESH